MRSPDRGPAALYQLSHLAEPMPVGKIRLLDDPSECRIKSVADRRNRRMSDTRVDPKLGCVAAGLQSVAPAHLNVVADTSYEYVRREPALGSPSQSMSRSPILPGREGGEIVPSGLQDAQVGIPSGPGAAELSQP